MRLLAVVVVFVITAVIVVPPLLPDSGGVPRAAARARGRATSAEVMLAPYGRATPVPRSFLGISTEYWALPQYEQHLRVFERVLSLLHVPGDGPFLLRVGGDSADHTFWHHAFRHPPLARVPSWVFELTPRWLTQTSTLVRHTHLRLIIDLNLVTGSSLAAAAWAHIADQALPRGSIAGFEVGNEPDIYSRAYWLALLAHSAFGAGLLPMRISPSQYAADFVSYARAIAELTPGVPLLGPALANPARGAAWLPSLLAVARRELATVTAHRYPFSACAKRAAAAYPTIARVLSERASAGMAEAVAGVLRLARRAGLPVRMTEMNSVTCGGRPGVSDTFATALWAPDALFELMRAGVQGVNVHVRTHAINAAFTLGPPGLTARPLLYGLVLFARTLGPGAELVPLRVSAVGAPHFKAWAVRTSGGLHVLLINKGYRSVSAALNIPPGAAATVDRLSAPSSRSPAGVTLAGRSLGRDGRWHGPIDRETLIPSRRGYRLTVPAISAALVKIRAPSRG